MSNERFAIPGLYKARNMRSGGAQAVLETIESGQPIAGLLLDAFRNDGPKSDAACGASTAVIVVYDCLRQFGVTLNSKPENPSARYLDMGPSRASYEFGLGIRSGDLEKTMDAITGLYLMAQVIDIVSAQRKITFR